MGQNYRRPVTALWKNMRGAVKQLRVDATDAEKCLWPYLRDRRFYGFKFRRQHPLDRFVVDYCCAQARLIVEIDGPIHRLQADEDQKRQAILEEMGFTVLRFSNEQVLEHTDHVLECIRKHLLKE